MREIRTERMINAPPADVWEVLTDLSSYPNWNPHLVNATADSDLRVGSNLKLRVRRQAARDRSMNVTVTEMEPGRKVAWVGTLLTPLLFSGRHTFELELFAGNRTRFVNREEIRGILAPIVTTAFPERDYEAMNEALKQQVEATAAAPV